MLAYNLLFLTILISHWISGLTPAMRDAVRSYAPVTQLTSDTGRGQEWHEGRGAHTICVHQDLLIGRRELNILFLLATVRFLTIQKFRWWWVTVRSRRPELPLRVRPPPPGREEGAGQHRQVIIPFPCHVVFNNLFITSPLMGESVSMYERERKRERERERERGEGARTWGPTLREHTRQGAEAPGHRVYSGEGNFSSYDHKSSSQSRYALLTSKQ